MTQEIGEVMIPRDEYTLPIIPVVGVVDRCAVERDTTHPSNNFINNSNTVQKRPAQPLSEVREIKKAKSKSLQYVCKVPKCGDKFNNLEHLDTHMKLHQGVKPFTCNVCGKVCQTESKLKVHHASHASDGVKPKCDICERTFSSRSALTKHKKMLHKPKPHVCQHCNAGFEKHKYMAIHMKRVHADDPPDEVREPQSTESSPSFHLDISSPGHRVNVKQGTYSMPENRERLIVPPTSVPVSTYQLPQEQMDHSQCDMGKKSEVGGGAPISCEMCTSTFPSLAYLEQHMAVHLNERTFAPQSHNLTTHHKHHHPSAQNNGYGFNNSSFGQFVPMSTQASAPRGPQVFDKYICAVCNEQFLNLGSLKRHEAQHVAKHC